MLTRAPRAPATGHPPPTTRHPPLTTRNLEGSTKMGVTGTGRLTRPSDAPAETGWPSASTALTRAESRAHSTRIGGSSLPAKASLRSHTT
jgi:hypothetical protein